MKKTLLFIFLIVGFSSCNVNKFSITGEIDGLTNDTLVIEYLPLSLTVSAGDNDYEKDTVIAHQGKFHYDLSMHKSEDIVIYITFPQLLKKRSNGHPYLSDTRFVMLIMNTAEEIQITGSVESEDYLNYQVQGNSFSADYAKDRVSYKQKGIKIDSIEMQMDYYLFSSKSADVSLARRDSLSTRLFRERNELKDEIRKQQLLYIKENLNKHLAAYYLLAQPLDTFHLYYNKLVISVKEGMLEKSLKGNEVNYQEYQLKKDAIDKIVKGVLAPDFILKDLKGKDVSLSSLKGKYILLDFWGSWCGWCIKGAPKMKEYYNKYKNKIEFVGIACRDKEVDWRKAVSGNGLNWIQLKNDESEDLSKNIAIRYAVSSYPTKILLDKDLKIIDIFMGESNEFYKKLDALLR